MVAHSVLAPWILEISNRGREIDLGKLASCPKCDFSFFTRRYFDNELEAIYGGYRGQKYFEIRNSHEFWYSKKINNFNEESENINLRSSLMKKIFSESNIPLSSISNCIDFGGDSGQYFPEEITGLKILIDASNKTNGENGELVIYSRIEEVPILADLIMCCNVLEHVNDPYRTLQNLAGKLVKGGYLYLELPVDRFRVSHSQSTNFQLSWIAFAWRMKKIFTFLDFASTVLRNYIKYVPFLGIVKQSEHINYFSVKSLCNLIDKFEDLKIIKVHEQKLKMAQLNLGVIQVLATKI